MKSGSVATSFFSGFGEENQPAELGEVSTFVEGLGGLSNGFKKLEVLFQVFLVPLETLPHIEPLALVFLALVLVVLDQVGHQLFFAPVVVTPLAAGAFEVPNQPSLATSGLPKDTTIAPQRANVINQRRTIFASPAIN